MTAVVIDGKKKALEIRENLAREIAEAKARPVLAVVQVGDNPASQVYVRNKHNRDGMPHQLCASKCRRGGFAGFDY